MEKQKTQVAILGGAFNPPTRAHLALAQFLLSNNAADEIWLMPSYQHPYAKRMQEYHHRIAMCESLCLGQKGIKVSDAEMRIAAQSQGRTWELLQFLSETQPNCEFAFVMGQDNADSIGQWYRWQDLLANYRMIVLPRLQPDSANVESWYRHLPHLFFEQMPTLAVSSTAVRALLAAGGQSPEDLTPEVWNYIRLHKLYF